MSRISIWDMDFYYKKSFLPNPKLMKISSFHKQQGDLVNFVSEEYHINMPYDIYYIMRDKDATPRPSSKLIENNKVKLMGKGFKYQDNKYDTNEVIAAVRPDYSLYPEKEKNAYYNANIVQFYHNGKLLKVKQPFINTKINHKKTLVIDKEFWDSSIENIEFCLQELTDYKNIAFQAPIKLKILIENNYLFNLFLKLDFSQGTIFKFQNNVGSTYEDVLKLFDFYERLKLKFPHIKLGQIPIKTVLLDHWAGVEKGLEDLERCLKIAAESKEKKIRVLLVAPDRRRFETPYWYYFEILEAWTTYFEDYSYIEMMLHSSMKRFKLPWYAVLNDSLKWSLPNTNFLLSLMTRFPYLVENYGYVRWGDKKLEKELIDFNEVKKYKGILNMEEENE